MPYPIAKLAYGLRCRLSDLSAPVERYNLQTAAGGASICPPKLQKIVRESSENLIFRCKNGTVFVYKDFNDYVNEVPFKVSQDDFIRINNGSVSLYKFDAQSIKSDIFNHFLFKADPLGLKYCQLSEPFYKAVTTIFSKIQHLEISCFNENCNIIFTDLLRVFPCLQSLEATGPFALSENWIAEILQVKNHSLMSLTTSHDSLLNGRLDFNKFLTLIKAQRPGFRLRFFVEGPPGWFQICFPSFVQFLDRNLERSNEHLKYKNCTRVFIHEQMWYLP